jgi:hypothetical protein
VITLYVSMGLFILMLLLPIALSFLMLGRSGDTTLPIAREQVKDPRFFAKSFARLFEARWAEYDGSGTIGLSRADRPESLLEAGRDTEYPRPCERIVYAGESDFCPPPGVAFYKEIYARGNAGFEGTPYVRAVYCKKTLRLGEGTQIGRWADAEGPVYVQDHCALGISASSAALLRIGYNCRFRRLYAPAVFFGYPEDERAVSLQAPGSAADRPVLRGARYVDEDATKGTGRLEASVITSRGLAILDGITVEGHVRGERNVRVHDGAVIWGNLFAEGDVHLGRDAWVCGSVFTQGDFYAEGGARVGQPGKIKSVIARGRITFEKGAVVYGYISTETGGEGCPGEPDGHNKLQHAGKWDPEEEPEELTFHDAKQFEAAAAGFRHHRKLREVVVPAGVTRIPESCFFGCERLARVVLPKTIEQIGDFAFFGCTALEQINPEECPKLDRIGRSAFERCASLRSVTLPASLRLIGEAAFCDSGLERLLFEQASRLRELGSHALKGCAALREVNLPGGVGRIGMSAFYGCEALSDMTLPASVKYLGPYAFAGCTGLGTLALPLAALENRDETLKTLPEQIVLRDTSGQIGAASAKEESS